MLSTARSRAVILLPPPHTQGRKEGEAMAFKFPMGRLITTAGVMDRAASDEPFAKFVRKSLERHSEGDWGDLSAGDKKENESALGRQLRLFSAYEHNGLPKIWIITEADRSVTTVLFPAEY